MALEAEPAQSQTPPAMTSRVGEGTGGSAGGGSDGLAAGLFSNSRVAQAPAGSRASLQPVAAGAAAAAGPASASRAAAPSAQLWIDQAAFCILSLAQFLLWLSQLSKAETLTQKMQPAMVMILTLLGAAVSLCLPDAYQRNR